MWDNYSQTLTINLIGADGNHFAALLFLVTYCLVALCATSAVGPGREVDRRAGSPAGQRVVEHDRPRLDIDERGFQNSTEPVIGCVVGPHREGAALDQVIRDRPQALAGVERGIRSVQEVAW